MSNIKPNNSIEETEEEYPDYTKVVNPDAYLYGCYDAKRRLKPEPEEYGYFGVTADAYNWAYQVELKSQHKQKD
jgi:hypothetical protein